MNIKDLFESKEFIGKLSRSSVSAFIGYTVGTWGFIYQVLYRDLDSLLFLAYIATMSANSLAERILSKK